MMTRPPRAVLFDFNGTISIDEHILDALFREVFATIGIRFDSDFYYQHLAGLSDPEIVTTALALHHHRPDADLAARLLRQKIDAYKRVVAANPTITTATAAAVRAAAARVPVAIGSGAVREEIDFVLAQHDLAAVFGAIVTIDDVTHGKPDPETWLRCVAELNRRGAALTVTDCLVFDDSPHGIAAARAAGMRCVGVRSSPDAQPLAAADRVIDHLDAVLVEEMLG
jgi:beta-phosphoglucomutase